MIILKRKLNINSQNAYKIIEIIRKNKGKARIIGGAVRDALAGKQVVDIDIATDLLPKQVIEIFTAKKIKVIPTGIKFGTVSVFLDGEAFEITTLRRDISCDGRHAKVQFTDDFAVDAARRDFTINALGYCPVNHEIYDYFDGLNDLKAQKVRFIGDATERIKEDYLRILRFFRFSCRFASKIDKEGLLACMELAENLKKISRERIKAEIDGLLLLIGSEKILSVMFKNHILQQIFPVSNYEETKLFAARNFATSKGVELDLGVQYALLLMQNESMDFKRLTSLKFSRNEARFITSLLAIDCNIPLSKLELILTKIWLERDNFIQYFIYVAVNLAKNEVVVSLLDRLIDKEKPVFPVKGGDIGKMGFEGKEINEKFNALKDKWIESKFTLTKEELIAVLK